jgi:hypothetical protein
MSGGVDDDDDKVKSKPSTTWSAWAQNSEGKGQRTGLRQTEGTKHTTRDATAAQQSHSLSLSISTNSL